MVLTLVLILANVGPILAEWGRTAEDFIVLPFARNPQICTDGNGGLWGAGDVGGGAGIIHINRDGDTTWGNRIVQTLPNQLAWEPIAVAADNGDVILMMNVTKDRDLEIEDSVVVYLQRVNSDGELIWGEGGILLDTSNTRLNVGNIYKGPEDGTYLLYWGRNVINYPHNDSRLQLINDDGDLLWGVGGIGLGEGLTSAKIITTSDRCVLVAHNISPTPAIEVIKLNPDGERLWETRLPTLSRGIIERSLQDIESDREGGAIFVYAYEREDSVRNYSGLNALRISSDGDSLWTTHIFERNRVGFERFWETAPIINYVGSGCFFVAWVAEIEWPYACQVMALSANGELLWDSPVDIMTSGNGKTELCGVESDSAGYYFWDDYDPERPNGTNHQQWGQRISLGGERLWGDHGIVVQARSITLNHAISNGAGGAITMVEFGNSGTVQMINSNGEIGAALEVSVDSDFNNSDHIERPSILSIYPNPGNSYLHLSLSTIIPNETIRYRMYDLIGRSVMVGTIRGFPYLIKDLSGISSGEYILQLESPRMTVSRKFSVVK